MDEAYKMENKMEKDWTNRDVPSDETPDTEILVWKVCPHLQNSENYDYVLIRGWQDMLKFCSANLEYYLEQFTEEELLQNGINIEINLEKMKKSEYDEIIY